jgi:hypothetical protein
VFKLHQFAGHLATRAWGLLSPEPSRQM